MKTITLGILLSACSLAIASTPQVYNVKDSPYLAVGNGVHNDQTNIQAAIDAAELNGGGKVFLPAGVYALGTDFVHPDYTSEGHPSALTIRSNNVFLVGDGIDITIIRPTSFDSGGENIFGSNNTTNIGFSNLTIDGNRTAPSGGGVDATQIYSNGDVFFDHVKFIHIGSDAIDTQYGGNVFADHIFTEDITGNSLSLQNSYTRCTHSHFSGGGFGQELGENGVLVPATAVENFNGVLELDSVFIEKYSSIMRMDGSVLYANNCSFYPTNNSGATNVWLDGGGSYFNNCVFDASGDTMAYVYLRTNRTASFRNCVFYNKPGIYAASAAGLEVRGCTFNNDSGIGVRVSGGSGFSFVNNQFNTSSSGIRMDTAPPTHNTIASGNTFNGGGWYIENGGTNNLVANNTFLSGAVIGLWAGDRNIINGNILNDTSTKVYLGTWTNYFRGNTINEVNFQSAVVNFFEGNTIQSLTGNSSGIANSIFRSNVKADFSSQP
jgi:polygalacturonase